MCLQLQIFSSTLNRVAHAHTHHSCLKTRNPWVAGCCSTPAVTGQNCIRSALHMYTRVRRVLGLQCRAADALRLTWRDGLVNGVDEGLAGADVAGSTTLAVLSASRGPTMVMSGRPEALLMLTVRPVSGSPVCRHWFFFRAFAGKAPLMVMWVATIWGG